MEEKMTILEKNIKKAESIINEQNKFIPNSGILDKIEPFATENIKELLKYFNLHNKNILTLLGNGDQTIDMILNGSIDITTFDINPLTKYYYALKKAALNSNITREEYLKYFCFYNYPYYHQLNKHSFSKEIFEKICTFLDEENYKFWCYLYDNYQPFEIRNGKSLFLCNELNHNILTKTINYLNNDTNFYIIKEKIKEAKINFINEDIKKLPNKLTEQFDFIYLSNIIEYLINTYLDSINKIQIGSQSIITQKHNQSIILQEISDILKTYSSLLTQNGVLVNYIAKKTEKNYNNIFLEQSMKIIFSNDKYSFIDIDSIEKIKRKIYYKENICVNDKCIIYTKR